MTDYNKVQDINKAMSGKIGDPVEPKKVSHELLRELIEINDDILEEMKTMNKNLAIVGVALIELATPMIKMDEKQEYVTKLNKPSKTKKSVDKV